MAKKKIIRLLWSIRWILLIVFWWFSHSRVSGWLLDILVRDSFGLGVRGNLSLGPTRKSVRMAWKMLNKVARSCLCLIFPLVPVSLASSLSYHFNIQQSKGSGQLTGPSQPNRLISETMNVSALSPEYWFVCPQQLSLVTIPLWRITLAQTGNFHL